MTPREVLPVPRHVLVRAWAERRGCLKMVYLQQNNFLPLLCWENEPTFLEFKARATSIAEFYSRSFQEMARFRKHSGGLHLKVTNRPVHTRLIFLLSKYRLVGGEFHGFLWDTILHGCAPETPKEQRKVSLKVYPCRQRAPGQG